MFHFIVFWCVSLSVSYILIGSQLFDILKKSMTKHKQSNVHQYVLKPLGINTIIYLNSRIMYYVYTFAIIFNMVSNCNLIFVCAYCFPYSVVYTEDDISFAIMNVIFFIYIHSYIYIKYKYDILIQKYKCKLHDSLIRISA